MKLKQARKRIKATDVKREIEESIVTSYEKNVNLHLKRVLNLNQKQLECLNLIRDDKTNMVLVDGPAGTAKTYVAVYGALEMLKDGDVDQIIYIRSIIESASRSIGALPGEIDEKFQPYAMPLVDKLNEIIDPGSIKWLFDKQMVKAIPVNFVRGLTFNKTVVIVDEAQNMDKSELTTILTRFGRDSKYIVIGDTFQSDIGRNSGFSEIVSRFSSDKCVAHGIHALKFTEQEIVRSKILKFIVDCLK